MDGIRYTEHIPSLEAIVKHTDNLSGSWAAEIHGWSNVHLDTSSGVLTVRYSSRLTEGEPPSHHAEASADFVEVGALLVALEKMTRGLKFATGDDYAPGREGLALILMEALDAATLDEFPGRPV